MASLLGQVAVRVGITTPASFAQSGIHGDWQTIHIPFSSYFPATAIGKIRVFATSSRGTQGATEHVSPAVPVVGEISPLGFTIWARNADIVAGRACFNWIAVAEVPDTTPATTGALFGLLSPQFFSTAAKQGDWNGYSVPIPASRQPANAPVIVASPGNANVRVHASAAIPVMSAASTTQVALQARNSDVGPGLTSFYYAGFLPGITPPSNLVVDTGRVPPIRFQPGARRGDWQAANVAFAEHFIAPPVVVVTADNYDGNLRSNSVAAVALANDVTPYGFTLAARNSDVSGGYVAFGWMAIGYAAT